MYGSYPYGRQPYDNVILAASGGGSVTGTLATTEAADIAAFSGSVLVSGTLSTTESPDIALFSGTVGNIISGTFATTEATDTAAFSGSVLVSGTLVTTDGTDTASFSGSVLVSGTFATTEGSDVTSFSGSVTSAITGTWASTESPDICNFQQQLAVGGLWKAGMEELSKHHTSETYPNRYPTQDINIKHSASILSTAGGHARAASLSPWKRSAIATIAAKARWK